MTFHPTDRLALCIDGADLHGAKRLRADIDYKKLLDFVDITDLVSIVGRPRQAPLLRFIQGENDASAEASAEERDGNA